MIIHYLSLLNIVDTIHSDVLQILRDIDNSESSSPSDYTSNVESILSYAHNHFAIKPLNNATRSSDLVRHLGFAKYYTQKGKQIAGIQSNLNDVILADIPEVRKWLIEYFNKSIDTELLHKTENLLKNNELTSAVRVSFVLLSARIRTALDIPDTANDGVGLIDCAFSKNKEVKFRDGNNLTEKEKGYFRSILSGFYSTVRNDGAHEMEVSIEAAHAALATINYVLKTLKI